MAQIIVPDWYKGENKILFFQIFQDDARTIPYDLASLPNVVVWVMDECGTVLGKYAMDTLPDHNTDDFVILVADEGSFKINLQKSINYQAPEGMVSFEIMIADLVGGFDNDKFRSIAKENFAIIKDSKTGGLL